MTTKAEYLTAMKATSIPSGSSGLWFIEKATVVKPKLALRMGRTVICPPGIYTHLFRVTDSTMHLVPPGDVVMEDTPFEPKTHLGFVRKAYGNVLITGLGLGCVIRGLLANPKVAHVTCIENSKDVPKLVSPHMPTERLTIVEADALKWTATNKAVFDCAWHDLWTDRDNGEPHLDFWHSQLVFNCRGKVQHQGAWAMHHKIKERLISYGFDWME